MRTEGNVSDKKEKERERYTYIGNDDFSVTQSQIHVSFLLA